MTEDVKEEILKLLPILQILISQLKEDSLSDNEQVEAMIYLFKAYILVLTGFDRKSYKLEFYKTIVNNLEQKWKNQKNDKGESK